jgi:hypothetical protein
MYSIHYKDSVVRDNDRTRSDKEVLEKLVVTDMVTVRILNREVYTFHTSPGHVTEPALRHLHRLTSGPTSGSTRSRSQVLPCDREHGPAIRKRHVGCH